MGTTASSLSSDSGLIQNHITDLTNKLNLSTITIKSLETQLLQKNSIISNYKLPKSELDKLSSIANVQVLQSQNSEFQKNINELNNQVGLLQTQLNATSSSSEFVQAVQGLQKINTNLKLNISEISQIAQFGVGIFDEIIVRNKILTKTKGVLYNTYGASNLDYSNFQFPNEDIAKLGSSEFFLYYIYNILSSLNQVSSLIL